MKIFNTLLEIKTGKKDFPLKAVFVENSLNKIEWRYFIYYYDILNHTFYINDLDYLWSENKTSAINIIEHIITRAFSQELKCMTCHLASIQIRKKPKVFSMYRQKTWLIIIDKINLKTNRDDDWNIMNFKNPSWNINDTNDVKLKKIRKYLSDFYKNKSIQ